MFKTVFLLFLTAVAAVNTTVDLNYLKVQGIDPGYGVSQWFGIPYATPPLGQYRWKAPVDFPPSTTVYNASSHKPVCLATGATYVPRSAKSSEDCLYLDVYAPTQANVSSALPVYIFIQGGGFNINAHPNCNGTSLINASGRNIIVVTFNYRVGMWGFLASGEVAAKGALNVGLLDQRKVFQWVKDHISQFGGDPNHITIGGPSAGGASVFLHMAAYGGRDDGLFHAAAAESPSFGPQLTVAQAQYQYDNFVGRVGCSNKTDTLSCLRSRSTALLQNNTAGIAYPGRSGSPIYMWSNVIDGNFTRDYTYRAFANGLFVKVPTISGAVTNDGTQFAPKSAASTDDMNNFMQNNFPYLNSTTMSILDGMYPPGQIYPSAQSYWPPTAEMYGNMRYLCPSLFVSDQMFQSSVGSWNYHYNVTTAAALASGDGVPHTIETNAIWYPTPYAPSSYNAKAFFVKAMQSYWASFILCMDPNPYRLSGSTEWQQWQPLTGRRVVINNYNSTIETPPVDLMAKCAYLQSIAFGAYQ